MGKLQNCPQASRHNRRKTRVAPILSANVLRLVVLTLLLMNLRTDFKAAEVYGAAQQDPHQPLPSARNRHGADVSPVALIRVDASLQNLPVDKLIRRLVQVSDDITRDYCTGSEVDFMLLTESSNQEESGEHDPQQRLSPVLRELVRRGLNVLPSLLDHLQDSRMTQITIEDRTVRVGDLCYLAIGQILDEEYYLLHYPPGKLGLAGHEIEVESPVESKELAQTVTKKWRGLNAEQYQQILAKKALNTTPHPGLRALERLCVYYPDVGEQVALKLLRRPLYDQGRLWSFIRETLAQEKDPSKWKKLIDDYLLQNGNAAAAVLPLWIHWIYFETSFGGKKFDEQKALATKILSTVYPDFDRRMPAFLNAVDIEDQESLVSTLSFFRSEQVDRAVHSLFLKARDFDYQKDESGNLQGDGARLGSLAVTCMDRLSHTRYGEDYRDFCRQKIKELETRHPADLRSIDHWHKLLTGRRKSSPLTTEQLAIVDRLTNMGVIVDRQYADSLYFYKSAPSSSTDDGSKKLPPSDEALALASQLPYLKKIVLRGAVVTDAGLKHLRGLRSLEELDLDDTLVTSDGLRHLRHLAGLRDLSLNKTNVNDDGLAHLSRLGNLQRLRLRFTDVRGDGLQFLRGLANLKFLDLRGCSHIGSGDLKHVAGLKSLDHLTLDSLKIEDAGLVHLEDLKNLESLILIDSGATPSGISRLQSALPRASIDYSWEFIIDSQNGNVVFDSDRLEVVFEDALWIVDRDGDVVSGRIYLSSSTYSSLGVSSDDVDFSVRYGDDVARVKLSCPRSSMPDAKATYAFDLTQNGATLKCGKHQLDLGDADVTVVISPNGVPRLELAD